MRFFSPPFPLSDFWGRTLCYHCSQICTESINVGIYPGLVCSNRYGFVEFDDPRDADDAVYDLNGKELCGERVIVEHTKGPRRDGGYGGGGGGRSKYPLGCLNSHVIHCSDSVSLRGKTFFCVCPWWLVCIQTFAEGHWLIYTHQESGWGDGTH